MTESDAAAHDAVDLAIIGAGAAGLMAGISAGRTGSVRSMVILEGARRPGAKILVSGGGRCNVTHHEVDASAFCGSSPAAIRKVLRRFDVPETLGFFASLGVRLRREKTGKLFPEDGNARAVLQALLSAAAAAGARVVPGWRVQTVARDGDRFVIAAQDEARAPILAQEVILATGGRSLPRSGSDGHGYGIARSLGHSITSRVLPALVPLTLAAESPLRSLQGISAEAELRVIDGARRPRAQMRGPVLCAHFGLSGPAVLDISRHWLHARLDDPAARLEVSWLPEESFASLDARLVAAGGAGSARVLSERLPARLAAALCAMAGVDPAAPCGRLERADRQRLARMVTGMDLPVTGDRGFTYAEVTAGGVPLSELQLGTMRSRLCPGLLVCGEICDVDGRIGGFNFQWAWASGYVAGISAGGRAP